MPHRCDTRNKCRCYLISRTSLFWTFKYFVLLGIKLYENYLNTYNNACNKEHLMENNLFLPQICNYKVNILLNGMSCYTISTIWIWMLLLDLLLYLMMGGLGGSWPAAGWRHFLLQDLAAITMKKMMMRRLIPNEIYKNRNLLYFIHSTIVVMILPTMYPLIQRQGQGVQSDVGSRLNLLSLTLWISLLLVSYFWLLLCSVPWWSELSPGWPPTDSLLTMLLVSL